MSGCPKVFILRSKKKRSDEVDYEDLSLLRLSNNNNASFVSIDINKVLEEGIRNNFFFKFSLTDRIKTRYR